MRKIVPISEQLKQELTKKKILAREGNIIAAVDEANHLEVFRDALQEAYRDPQNKQQAEPQRLFTWTEKKAIHSVAILKDFSGLVVCSGNFAYHISIDGKQITKIETMFYQAGCSVYATETALSFLPSYDTHLHCATLFQYPMKPPFIRPVSVNFRNINEVGLFFQEDTNFLFSEDRTELQSSLTRYDVLKKDDVKLFACSIGHRTFFTQGNVIVSQHLDNIYVWNSAMGIPLRMLNIKTEFGLDQNSWIIAFEGSTIYFGSKKVSKEASDEESQTVVLSAVTFSAPQGNDASK